MRRVVPLAVALLLSACTSGTPKPSANPTPTPSAASPTASPSAGRSLVLAITVPEEAAVRLYRVGPDRRATLFETLSAPSSLVTPHGLSLSAGATPEVCVVWEDPPTHDDNDPYRDIACYQGASDPAPPFPARNRAEVVALDPTAGHVFWTESSESGATVTGWVASFERGRLSAQREVPLDCGYVLGAAWSGQDRLVLHCTSGDNDDPGSLVIAELQGGSAPRLGAQIGDDEQFVSPGSADARTVVALERVCSASCDSEFAHVRPSRAVRVELRSGKVLEVIATPAKGRYVSSVTGGAHGTVYVTNVLPDGDSRDQWRVYLRWPGERHGMPITGLPADLETVVAQP